MTISNRSKIFATVMAPLLLIYVSYYLLMSYIVNQGGNLYIFRAKNKAEYSRTKIPNKIDFLILGDSSALYAIDPTKLSPKSYSIANLGSTLRNSFHSLVDLENTTINNGILITQTFIESHYDDDIWKILVPAKLLNLSELYQVYCIPENSDCSIQRKSLIFLKFIFAKLHINQHSLENATLFFQNLLEGKVKIIDRRFEKSILLKNGHYASASRKIPEEKFMEPFYKSFKKEVTPPLAEIYYLKKIIQHAKAKNLKVFFVLTPMMERYKDSKATQYYNSIYKILNQISDENFKIIDGRKLLPNLSLEDFLDYNHLNEKGADHFSQFLNSELQHSEVETKTSKSQKHN